MSKPTEKQFQKAAWELGCSVAELKQAFKERAALPEEVPSGMAMMAERSPTIADVIRADLTTIEQYLLSDHIGQARDVIDRIRSYLPQKG